MTRQDLENLYVLSPLQQGLLFHSLYSPASGLYVDQFILDLHGDVKPQLLERAWQSVVSRHASLRTSFHWENLDKPLQAVMPEAQLPFEHHDWRELSEAGQEERLTTLLKEDRAHGFRLSEAPLMRLALIRLSKDLYRLIWTVHHIILDAWSASIVQNEVLSSYATLVRGDALPFEGASAAEDDRAFDDEAPFSSFISWLRQQDLSKAEPFWRQALAGFTSPTRFDVFVGTAEPSDVNADAAIQLSTKTTSRLVVFAQRHKLTLNTVVQGVWSLLSHRYSGEHDVVFGVTMSGRSGSIAGIEHIVGNLLNTLPFRVRVSSQDVVSFLREIQNRQVELRDYEHCPLTEIQEWSELPSNEPLFDSILVFENAPAVDVSGALNGSPQISGFHHLWETNYPLTVQVIPGSNLFIRIQGNPQRFPVKAIRRMLENFETLLEGMVSDPRRSISTLTLVGEDEVSQLRQWNSTAADNPRNTFSELLERQAAVAADAVAVVYGEEQLSYGELNRRANQLAHYLRRHGVGPESLIGICMERSVEMLVAIVGTLKAGAAYVPLDPSYPPQRLSFMLEDAEVPVLLTQERLRDNLPALSAHVLSLDVDWEEMAGESEENLSVSIDAQHPAYVIYTSGSTGTPKGVMVK
ncbi:MAG TPA: condensation domain-containing protein, partial [Pyrinomonadaceae bacterium]|nr:condensation domain-containing protein [Pyrinomonadaceae bacterium]